MPIYEFRCRECGEVFEKLCKINTKTEKCKLCNEGIGDKIVSLSAFVYGDSYDKGKKELRRQQENLDKNLKGKVKMK